MDIQVVCRCGAAFAAPAQSAGQTIQCANCLQPVAVPNAGVGSAPPQTYYAPHEQSNTLATTGFILSLVSFCIILLAPVAMIVSYLGLKKNDNHGIAVAGFVIGGFQTVVLMIGMFWLFFLGGLAIWTTGKAVEIVDDVVDQAKIERTKETIAAAARTIDDSTTAKGRLPVDGEGTQQIKFHEDAWGRPLRYNVSESQPAGYSIKCSGPDGQWDTTDDVAIQFPALAPTNVGEALALLTNKSEHRQRAGLEWLGNAPRSDEDAARVIDAIIPLLVNQSLSELNRHALGNWLSEEELPRLIAAIKPYDNKVDSAAVINALVDLNSEEGLLLLLNHTNNNVRAETDRALRELGTDDQRIVRRCIEDLDAHERQRQAIARLQAMTIDDSLKSEVAEGIFQALLNSSILSASLPDAVGLAVDCDPEAVDQQLIRAFIGILGKPGVDSSRASEVLIALGPVAENQVAAALSDSSRLTRINACSVLAKIGSERSLPALRELGDDRFAQSAITSIKEAKREPVDSPTN